MASPMRAPVKKAMETMCSASRLLPAPMDRVMKFPLPIPTIKERACMIDMAEKMIPTAPDALVPIWLTKKVSAIL